MKLFARIQIEECKTRLEHSVDRLEFLWTPGVRPIVGKLRDKRFQLQIRRNYRNSFAPFFFGRFEASNEGTYIIGEFSMHPFVKVLMVLQLSFLAFCSMIILIAVVTGIANVEISPVQAFMIPAGFAAFIVALTKFGHLLGQSEEAAIIEFLKKTFEAEEILH